MSDLFPELFDKFWDAYPRKVGKKNAHKAFSKLGEQEQRAALADVQKRNRFKAWSGNKKLVPHAATYLNQERWTDEWLDELKVERDDLPNTGPMIPKPKQPEREVPLSERQINRAYRDYLFIAHGIDSGQTGPALKLKQEILRDVVPAFVEDIQSGATTPFQAATEIVDLFLTRMDLLTGRKLRESVWTHIKRSR